MIAITKKPQSTIQNMMDDILNNSDKIVAQLKKDSISTYGLKPTRPNTPFLTPNELAQALDVSIKTLERMRNDGSGPPFIKIGNKRIRYPIVSLDAWIKQKEISQLPASAESTEILDNHQPV